MLPPYLSPRQAGIYLFVSFLGLSVKVKSNTAPQSLQAEQIMKELFFNNPFSVSGIKVNPYGAVKLPFIISSLPHLGHFLLSMIVPPQIQVFSFQTCWRRTVCQNRSRMAAFCCQIGSLAERTIHGRQTYVYELRPLVPKGFCNFSTNGNFTFGFNRSE